MRYFIHDGKKQRGPFTTEELRDAGLTPDFHVWRDGMRAWVKASELEELAHLLLPVPPPFPLEDAESLPPPIPEPPPEAPAAEHPTPELPVSDAAESSDAAAEKVPTHDTFRLSAKAKALLAAGIFTVFVLIVVFILWKRNQEVHQELTVTKQEAAQVQQEKEVVEEQQAAAQEQLAQVQQQEQQKQAAEAADVKAKFDLRNNWESYIEAEIDLKTPLPLGGFSDIRVAVQNKTAFPLDLVSVEVTYLTANNYVFKTETVNLDNITAGGIGYGYAPDSQRGSYLRAHISKITARAFNFCYDDFAVTGHSDDPYRCTD
jgi:hypothetical protein